MRSKRRAKADPEASRRLLGDCRRCMEEMSVL
jgi:hypothetical protein